MKDPPHAWLEHLANLSAELGSACTTAEQMPLERKIRKAKAALRGGQAVSARRYLGALRVPHHARHLASAGPGGAGPSRGRFELAEATAERLIHAYMWQRRSAEWETERADIARQLAALDTAKTNDLASSVKLLELAQRAHDLYVSQAPHEQRRLLNVVVSNCALRNARVFLAKAVRPARGPRRIEPTHLAESKGFEPLVSLHQHLISNQAPSATRTALHPRKSLKRADLSSEMRSRENAREYDGAFAVVFLGVSRSSTAFSAGDRDPSGAPFQPKQSYFGGSTTISTRRFCARPSMLLLSAIGLSWPLPTALTRSGAMPRERK